MALCKTIRGGGGPHGRGTSLASVPTFSGDPSDMRTRKRTIVTAAIAIPLAGWLAVAAPVRAAFEAQTASKAPASTMSPAALDKLLGPVALYPDQLLSQILLCASEPAKLATLNEWLVSNQNLKGSALQEAAMKAGFDASFVSIIVFPQVVDMMRAQPDWVRQLGQAFTTDRSGVFSSIQRLRTQAQKMGTLKTTPQQEVTNQTTPSGEQVIVIEPANEQVVYVPQYNPQVVYTQPATTTVVVQEDDDSGAAVAAGLIGFTAGIAMGAAMDNNYYYGPCCYGGFHMYNDAWDDYYDHREDAREDWADHREDLYEERGEQRENLANERTDRAETRNENRPQSQAERTERTQTRQTERTERQANRPPEAQAQAQAAAQQRSANRSSEEARGYSGGGQRATTQSTQRSGTSSGAFSGYSNGKSERAASSRGQSSRSGGRSGGGGGGGRRR